MSTDIQQNVAQFKSYQALLHHATKLYIQSHGQTGNFAFAIHGPDTEITKWHNLFCNMDTRPRNEYGDFPFSPRLVHIGPSLAYFNITKERLKNTLVLYFITAIPLLRDIATRYYYDEITETGVWERDEVEIERLANEAAEHFINNQIETHCFMPSRTNDALTEMSMDMKQNDSEHRAFRSSILGKSS